MISYLNYEKQTIVYALNTKSLTDRVQRFDASTDHLSDGWKEHRRKHLLHSHANVALLLSIAVCVISAILFLNSAVLNYNSLSPRECHVTLM